MFLTVRLSSLSKVGLLISLMFSSYAVQGQSTDSNDVVSQAAPQNQQSGMGFSFPQWPKRSQATREIIPPPPPGPYMSSALSPMSNGNSVKAPSFVNSNRRNRHFDPSSISMDSFSPDIPWPTNMRPPSRWVPEDGYRYVEPQAMPQTPPAMSYQSPAGNSVGYHPQSGPTMNWSGMRHDQNPNNYQGNYPTRQRSNMPSNMPPNMSSGGMSPMYSGQTRPYPNQSNNYPPNRRPVSRMPSQGYPQ